MHQWGYPNPDSTALFGEGIVFVFPEDYQEIELVDSEFELCFHCTCNARGSFDESAPRLYESSLCITSFLVRRTGEIGNLIDIESCYQNIKSHFQSQAPLPNTSFYCCHMCVWNFHCVIHPNHLPRISVIRTRDQRMRVQKWKTPRNGSEQAERIIGLCDILATLRGILASHAYSTI